MAAVDALAAPWPELTLTGAARAVARKGPRPKSQGDRLPIPSSTSSWSDFLRTDRGARATLTPGRSSWNNAQEQ